ncbi:MAG TPA: hypothetical protein VL358_08860 [Caulobacteraceae bacterium]|jgi:hypothetical protein|nr:hypothetical protein [Caulobacteraceae bacterium]
MSLYFFHIDDGQAHRDEDGRELPNLTEARRQAADLAGHMLADGTGGFWDGRPWSVRVADGAGLALFELHLTAINAPATMGSKAEIYQKPLG